MNEDLQLLSAYLDGELDAELANQVNLRLACEPQFSAQLQKLRQQNNLFIDSVQQIDNAPVSAGLAALLAADTSKPPQGSWRDWLWHHVNGCLQGSSAGWVAAVSSVALIAVMLFSFSTRNALLSEPLGVAQGSVAPQLGEFLSTRISGAQLKVNGLHFEQKLAFFDDSKTLCKYYLERDTESVIHAIACFQGGYWQNQFVLLSEAPPAENLASYQPAGVDMDADLERYLSRKIQQSPLDSAAEETALVSIKRAAGN